MPTVEVKIARLIICVFFIGACAHDLQQRYARSVRVYLLRHLQPPSTCPKEATCHLSLQIDDAGVISSVQILSDDGHYDCARDIVAHVKAIGSLPKPPPALKDYVLQHGFHIMFNARNPPKQPEPQAHPTGPSVPPSKTRTQEL